ncbi:MAG: amidohydrolase family protein, partial [Deltaproteobacteria bacterium]|nr:amidohydrolase family protein [Deltaproteobacteria bacterium]
VAFLEANCSWLPWLLWRLDEAYELEGDIDMTELKMMPSEYFKRQCIASVEPDETPARYTIESLGNDNFVYSTDYPHGDSRYPHATESFLQLPFTDEDKRKILWDNCARFYGFKEPAGIRAGQRAMKPQQAHIQLDREGIYLWAPAAKMQLNALSPRPANCLPGNRTRTNGGRRCRRS